MAIILGFAVLFLITIAVGFLYAVFKGRSIKVGRYFTIGNENAPKEITPHHASEQPVKIFYDSLKSRDFHSAWETLNENCKRSWENMMDTFQCGYENMQSISNIQVFPLSTQYPTEHEYGVFYHSVTNGHLITELHSLRFQSLKSVGDIFQNLEKLRKRLIGLGINEDEVNNLQLKFIIKENVADYIRYKLHLSKDFMDAEFSPATEVDCYEICQLFVVKNKYNKLKIDRIQNLTRIA